MAKKLIRMAICYDFDGTLSPGNMQEYGFMASIHANPKQFWEKNNKYAAKNFADVNLAYMKLMLEEAGRSGVPYNKEAFKKYGQSVKLYKGVESWFKRINTYGKKHGIDVKHYIISSGLKEIIENTSIGKNFEYIFACAYIYDANGIPVWPANVVNYTSKTQYLFRINKDCCDINDNKTINAYIKESDRPVPFKHMIFIGDGNTDIPAMKMVKSQGGHAIAVYNASKKGKKEAARHLITEDRVNIIADADYSNNKAIDIYVKSVIDKIEIDNKINRLEREAN